jgi:hypothetical protein
MLLLSSEILGGETMIHSKRRLQIINRFPGVWTGQEFLETDDGEIWEVGPQLPERGTGDKQGHHTEREVFEL